MKNLINNDVKYVILFNYIYVKPLKKYDNKLDIYYHNDYLITSADIDYEYACSLKELYAILKKYRKIDYCYNNFNFDVGSITTPLSRHFLFGMMSTGWIMTKVVDTHGKKVSIPTERKEIKKYYCGRWRRNARYYRNLSYKHCRQAIETGKFENRIILHEYAKQIKLRKRANSIDAWNEYPRHDYRDNSWKRKRIKKQYMKHSS